MIALVGCGGASTAIKGNGHIDDDISADRAAEIIGKVKDKLGNDAKVLDFSISTGNVGAVKYVAGPDKAAAYEWAAGSTELHDAAVKIIGTGGNLDATAFPIDKLDPDALGKTLEAVKGADKTFKPSTAGLHRNPVTGGLTWMITGDTDTHTGINYEAAPDGSGLKKL